MEGVIN